MTAGQRLDAIDDSPLPLVLIFLARRYDGKCRACHVVAVLWYRRGCGRSTQDPSA